MKNPEIEVFGVKLNPDFKSNLKGWCSIKFKSQVIHDIEIIVSPKGMVNFAYPVIKEYPGNEYTVLKSNSPQKKLIQITRAKKKQVTLKTKPSIHFTAEFNFSTREEKDMVLKAVEKAFHSKVYDEKVNPDHYLFLMK